MKKWNEMLNFHFTAKLYLRIEHFFRTHGFLFQGSLQLRTFDIISTDTFSLKGHNLRHVYVGDTFITFPKLRYADIAWYRIKSFENVWESFAENKIWNFRLKDIKVSEDVQSFLEKPLWHKNWSVGCLELSNYFTCSQSGPALHLSL